MKPLIKWPGGKSSEIKNIKKMIPEHNRYVEPFFGGGALFFDLMPPQAAINDISDNLMNFYRLVKDKDEKFNYYLNEYNNLWEFYKKSTEKNLDEIVDKYISYRNNNISDIELEEYLSNSVSLLLKDNLMDTEILLDFANLKVEINRMVFDKAKRTKQNEIKSNKLLTRDDLRSNLLTGFTSGFYMHFRKIYNDIQLGINKQIDLQYKIANFYFIREFCYGSMFRYNSRGEFNIPYGGISYNNKDFGKKIDQLFNEATIELFQNTDIYNLDFADFLNHIDPAKDDFIFLDPPYDTKFSNYEGRKFAENDQIRLAKILQDIKAKFILIIKNTDFIYSLYNRANFNIITFDKNYTYNVRSRNKRDVEHLIITNILK